MDSLLAYWSAEELATNGIILLHLLGSLAVGVVIGYERSYRGHAAGVRTYALVCVASCVLVVINGFPAHWFGGLSHTPAFADPTRTIQGIMTGIGFLGAGVIMKEGFTIRGLSTAASIWMTSAIGVVIGVGFYGAAIAAAGLTVLIMSGLRHLEISLPHLSTMHLTLVYDRNCAPTARDLAELVRPHGYQVGDWGYQMSSQGDRFEYQLVLQAVGNRHPESLVTALTQNEQVREFRLSPSRS